MVHDPMAHEVWQADGKLLDLYDQRDLLIFLQGEEWFNNQAIELLKKTFWKDYPGQDWKHHLFLWEFEHEIPEYSIKT